MQRTRSSLLKLLAAGCIGSLGSLAGLAESSASAAPKHSPHSLHVEAVLSGRSLQHTFVSTTTSVSTTEPLSHPDDLAQVGGRLFVGFQNGVGPQGEPTASGNPDSTIVEFAGSGAVLGQWDVRGKVDGLAGASFIHGVVATVNEDANSSLYTVQPWASPADVITHYAYNRPLAHAGGTDAITVVHSHLLISASAPGTSGTAVTPTPAVYVVTLDKAAAIATASPLFYDQDWAIVANVGTSNGQSTTLNLTDPDSNSIVPRESPRFGGAFELTSQGDLQQIYLTRDEGHGATLHVLTLSQAIDDTVWPTSAADHHGRMQSAGRLYATDPTNDTVDVITGDLGRQPLVVAAPCKANVVPTTCGDSPPTPANYLATLNMFTGRVTPVTLDGAPFVPGGGLLLVDQGAKH